MTKYDVRIKSFLRHGAQVLLTDMGIREQIGPVDTDVSYVRAPRVDYLGANADGNLVHIEVQSNRDSSMPIRMLEYYAHILRAQADWRRLDYQAVVERIRLRQFTVYMDDEPIHAPGLTWPPGLRFEYTQYSLATGPRSEMLASTDVGDIVLSLLCRGEESIQDRAREIAENIKALSTSALIDESVRKYAIGCLVVLGAIKNASAIIEEEILKLEMDIDFSGSEIFKEYAERDHCNAMIEAIRSRLDTGAEPLTLSDEDDLREFNRDELLAVLMDLHLGLEQAKDNVFDERRRHKVLGR